MSDVSIQSASVRARRVREPAPAPVAAPQAESFGGAPNPLDPPVMRADALGEPLGPVSPQRVRKPLGAHRQKLDNSERPGFHRHWFNDDKDRVKDALEAGYTHVKNAEGKPMSKVVGSKKEGGPMVAYRMELPLEWYNEDQSGKVAVRRQRQADMQRGVTGGGAPGQDGRYVPVGPGGQPYSNIRNDVR